MDSLAAVFWILAGSLYGLGALLGAFSVAARKPFGAGLGRVLAAFGFAVQTAAIAARWQDYGAMPFFRFAEAVYFLVWAIAAAYLAIELLGHVPGLGVFLLPLLASGYLATLGFRDAAATPRSVEPMLAVHIVFALLSYAFFVISFLMGAMYLVQTRALKRKRTGRVFAALPPVDLLEKWNAAGIAISFPLLTVSLGLGALYAVGNSDRSVAQWLSDPMVLASLLLWGIGASILALRYRLRIGGRRVADLTICGFAVVVLSLLGSSFVRHGGKLAASVEEASHER